jgi:GH15 family glucan-1,4-alpha-glucosidase
MQTFLPFKDFTMSAQALDNKRLNKQVLECYQILKVLGNQDPKAGWRNHPAVKMWRGSEAVLWNYTMVMIDEATNRGIKTDKNMENLMALYKTEGIYWGLSDPKWFNDSVKVARVTTTHQANLYKKDPQYYFEFYDAVSDKDNKPCCEGCNYYWVTHEEK